MGWVAIPLAVIGLAALSGGGGYDECCVYDVNCSHYPTAPPSHYYGGQAAAPGFAHQQSYQGYGGVDPYAASGTYPAPQPAPHYDAGAYGAAGYGNAAGPYGAAAYGDAAGAYGAAAYGDAAGAGVNVGGPGGVGAGVGVGDAGISGGISY